MAFGSPRKPIRGTCFMKKKRQRYAEMRLTCESMVMRRGCTQVILEIS